MRSNSKIKTDRQMQKEDLGGIEDKRRGKIKDVLLYITIFPMGGVDKRNKQSEISEEVKGWAEREGG